MWPLDVLTLDFTLYIFVWISMCSLSLFCSCLWFVAEIGLFVLFLYKPQKVLPNNSYFYCFGYYWDMFSCQRLFSLSMYKEFTFLWYYHLDIWQLLHLDWHSISALTRIQYAFVLGWLPSQRHDTTSFPLSLLLVLSWCFWKANCYLHHSPQAGYGSTPQGFLACLKPWVWVHTAKVTKMNK